jgi:hypothetical protein
LGTRRADCCGVGCSGDGYRRGKMEQWLEQKR